MKFRLKLTLITTNVTGKLFNTGKHE